MISIDVSVVVGANHRLIYECLESLLKYTPKDYMLNINVICNQPNTDVPHKLREKFNTENWKIIENPKPVGFAANHNSVLQISTAKYCFIINDDLAFLPNSVQRMVEFMELPENQNIAMLSPKLLNPDGSLQPSTYSFPSVLTAAISVSGLRDLIPVSSKVIWLIQRLWRQPGSSRFWDHNCTVDVDTFRGACVLARMKAVNSIGLMNTTTLVGVEETEWHYRFRQSNWRVVFYHEPIVIHYGGETIRTDSRLRNEYLKGFLYFFKRHFRGTAFIGFCLLSIVAYLWRYLAHLLSRDREARAIDYEALIIILRSVRTKIVIDQGIAKLPI
jgi:hypothetical protein